MTNPNDPAFARPFSEASKGGYAHEQEGLTKREYFAAIAMQGILANSTLRIEGNISEASVKMADALIAELNKKPKP